MQPSIFRFVLKYSRREQILLLVFTAMAFPFLYLSLDLPKTIINEAIGGRDFPRVVLGYELEQIPFLLVLCGIFLSLVFINGGFKYFINVYRGVVGERMLRRLRYVLFDRVLRFPLPQFRKTSQGELVSMITAETEPLGGFIGDSIALPAFQGGTLLTILIFMFIQDWVLGLAAISLYPVQTYVIPKLQRRVNQLRKERIVRVRKLSERIGEVVSGIREVHAHDTSQYELADFSERVGEIYVLRFETYKLKFFIKFINNFLAQVTPFFFYSIGGYLVIKNELSFGALVAVLRPGQIRSAGGDVPPARHAAGGSALGGCRRRSAAARRAGGGERGSFRGGGGRWGVCRQPVHARAAPSKRGSSRRTRKRQGSLRDYRHRSVETARRQRQHQRCGCHAGSGSGHRAAHVLRRPGSERSLWNAARESLLRAQASSRDAGGI
jgi:hypothetical protein